MAKVKPLPPGELTWKCHPDTFSFSNTRELLEPKPGVIGQDRAIKSIDFGLGLSDHGYNIYILGESGTGKESIVKERLEEKAIDEKVPDDWCYVYNFSDPDRPSAMNLPPGMGSVLKEDMGELVETLKRDIPRVFESKDYEKHRDEILDGQQERTKAIFYRLEQKAQEKGFILKKTVSGLAVVPAKDGKVLGHEDFEKLSKSEKARIEEESKFLQARLSDTIVEVRVSEKEKKDRINALDREVVQYVVNPLINELLEKYRKHHEVVKYLEQV